MFIYRYVKNISAGGFIEVKVVTSSIKESDKMLLELVGEKNASLFSFCGCVLYQEPTEEIR